MRRLALFAIACLPGCAALVVIEPEGTTVITPFGAISDERSGQDDGLTAVDDLPPATEDGLVGDAPAP